MLILLDSEQNFSIKYMEEFYAFLKWYHWPKLALLLCQVSLQEHSSQFQHYFSMGKIHKYTVFHEHLLVCNFSKPNAQRPRFSSFCWNFFSFGIMISLQVMWLCYVVVEPFTMREAFISLSHKILRKLRFLKMHVSVWG